MRGGKSSNDIATLLELYDLKTITIRRLIEGCWQNALESEDDDKLDDKLIVSSVAWISKVGLP